MPSIIQIQNLVKRYGAKNVVDDLSITVESGERLALLGPNGAGKTTTLKMLCGLIHPTSGSIQIDGYGIDQRRLIMPRLGVMLEGARNIYWRLSPWDNLIYFANLKGLRVDSTVLARMRRLLQELDLWERRDDEVRTFSRGMQQKVSIACALVTDPDIVLLDEPTLGLDVQAYDSMIQFIKGLSEQHKTILITSHHFDFIRETVDRVVVMNRRIIFDGSKDQIAQKYGGNYLIKVTGYHADVEQVIADNWRVIHHSHAETTLIGSGSLQIVLTELERYGCTLQSVEPMRLTAEVFLDLLKPEQGQVT